MSTACREEASAAGVNNRRLLCDELAAGARGEQQQWCLNKRSPSTLSISASSSLQTRVMREPGLKGQAGAPGDWWHPGRWGLQCPESKLPCICLAEQQCVPPILYCDEKLNRGEVSNTCPSRQGATQTEATKGKIDTPKHEHTSKNTKCMRDASTMKQGADLLKKKNWRHWGDTAKSALRTRPYDNLYDNDKVSLEKWAQDHRAFKEN